MTSRFLLGIFLSLPVVFAFSCHTYQGGLSKNIPERNKNLTDKDSVGDRDTVVIIQSPCPGWGKGDDSLKAVKTYSLYKELFEDGKYADALSPWQEFVNHHGGAKQSPYPDGIKIYEELIKQQTDQSTKQAMIDSMLSVYDHWIYCFPVRKGELLGYKAIKMYNYKIDLLKVLDTFEEAFQITGYQTKSIFLYPFTVTAIKVYEQRNLSLEELIDDYAFASSVIDKSIEPDIQSVREKVDEAIADVVSCELIKPVHEKWFLENPDDLIVLEKLVNQKTLLGCTDDTLYFQALKKMQDKKPNARNAYFLGNAELNNGNYNAAVDYFKDAIRMDSVEDILAECNFLIAEAYRLSDDFQSSKNFALKASSIRNDWGDPFILIAQLYAESMDDCTDGSLLHGKEVFWAAIDLLELAKLVDSESAAQATALLLLYAQFMPTENECFSAGIESEGSEYKIGCWINEKTKARFGKNIE